MHYTPVDRDTEHCTVLGLYDSGVLFHDLLLRSTIVSGVLYNRP